MTLDLAQAWSAVLTELQPQQRAWLHNSRPLTLHESTALVAVPNDFTRGQLEGRLRAQVEDALSEALGIEIHLAVSVDPKLDLPGAPPVDPSMNRSADLSTQRPDDLEASGAGAAAGAGAGADDPETPLAPVTGIHSRLSSDDPRRLHASGASEPVEVPGPDAGSPAGRSDEPASGPAFSSALDPDLGRPGLGASSALPARGTNESRLNPKYTFDTFVIGASNRFPHAAAVAAAEAPGRAYNPLLVWGDSGLGKTHLLHAIGHYVRSLYSGIRVRYVSSEEFTNEFINAIRDDRQDRFKRRYREVDVLLIDDIQFLEGKTQTQEEFFHTFNTLHTANKQIVLTSDRAPKRLEALEDRLRNRFEWGLLTDVQPPDLETRIAILRKKAAMDRMTAPPDVLEFIASRIHTNIRELEGALIRVTAFANLNKQDVDLTLAEIVLKDLIPEGGEPEITPSLIIGQTGAYFSVTLEELTGPSRGRSLVQARQIGMYLCRELTDLSLPGIGKLFGNRDHTTVMYADRKIKQLITERRAVYNQVAELTARIKAQARQG